MILHFFFLSARTNYSGKADGRKRRGGRGRGGGGTSKPALVGTTFTWRSAGGKIFSGTNESG